MASPLLLPPVAYGHDVLLTSDPDDLNKLAEEPDRPKAQRIVVV